MSQYFYAIVLNPNQSYPGYPPLKSVFSGRGKLTLEDNGMVFHPFDTNRLRPLTIHWDNLVSTYPSTQPYPDAWVNIGWTVMFKWWLTPLTLFQYDNVVGGVSVKFKEARYDKVCVLEFIVGGGFRSQAYNQAMKLDKAIWEYRRSNRDEVMR